MQHQPDRLNNPLEQAGYFESGGSAIYSVLHRVAEPIARVLLVGPFASERFASYVPWVRWARYLAVRGIEALRFDYRGVGESTGVFEEMGFAGWNQDVDFLASWLESQSPNVPLILHGLELGALLASKSFAAGVGDALLLWSAPKNANEVLRRPLARQVFKNVFDRRPVSEYIAQLEAGKPLDVDGYQWSTRLWRESFEFDTPLANSGESSAPRPGERPVRFVKLDSGAPSKLKGTAMGYAVSLNLDLSDLFADSFSWMADVPAVRGRP